MKTTELFGALRCITQGFPYLTMLIVLSFFFFLCFVGTDVEIETSSRELNRWASPRAARAPCRLANIAIIDIILFLALFGLSWRLELSSDKVRSRFPSGPFVKALELVSMLMVLGGLWKTWDLQLKRSEGRNLSQTLVNRVRATDFTFSRTFQALLTWIRGEFFLTSQYSPSHLVCVNRSLFSQLPKLNEFSTLGV